MVTGSPSPSLERAGARLRALLKSMWFKLALSAAMLAVLLSQIDIGQMRRAIAGAELRWVGLALLGLIAGQVTSAYRWFLLARAVGFQERFGQMCTYFFSGMYLNLFGPGTVTGDVGRTLFLGAGRRRALALTTVVAHRAIGFVALVWITATATLLLPDQPLPWFVRVLAALAIPGIIAAWVWGPRLAARLLPPSHRWRTMIERDLAPYWHNRRLLAVTMAWAAVAHAFQLSSQMAVARALSINVPWAFFLVVVPLVNIAGMVPLSLQGVGVRETGFLLYLSRINVPPESAIALGLLTSAVTLLGGLSGLPFFLLQRSAEQQRIADPPLPRGRGPG